MHPAEVENETILMVNDWTIVGKEGTYRETCECYAERSFVMCNTVDRARGPTTHSVGILRWSEATRNHSYHYYSQFGRTRSEICFRNDLSGLSCVHADREGEKLIESRSHIWPLPSGAVFSHEQSETGGPWKETVRLSYVARKRYRHRDACFGINPAGRDALLRSF